MPEGEKRQKYQPIKVKGADFDMKPVLEKELEEKYTIETVTVAITNLIDATVEVTGTVTGKKYRFNGAGDSQPVDIQDKDELLNKKSGRACCGGESHTSLFVLTE
jgi:hypothetical protein